MMDGAGCMTRGKSHYAVCGMCACDVNSLMPGFDIPVGGCLMYGVWCLMYGNIHNDGQVSSCVELDQKNTGER